MKAIREIKRKYYKYVESKFVQPILTSNGTMGGDSYGIELSNAKSGTAYQTMDNNTRTYIVISGKSTGGVIFYTPNALNISHIKCTFSGTNANANNTLNIYGSNDKVNWTSSLATKGISKNIIETDVSHQNFYKYWKILDTFSAGGSYAFCEISINGTQKVATETTQYDYDYYVEEYTYKLPKSVDMPTYYAINN